VVEADDVIGQQSIPIPVRTIWLPSWFPENVMVDDMPRPLSNHAGHLSTSEVRYHSDVDRVVPTVESETAAVQDNVANETTILSRWFWTSRDIDGVVEPVSAQMHKEVMRYQHIPGSVTAEQPEMATPEGAANNLNALLIDCSYGTLLSTGKGFSTDP
jgi:hypothetical protein